MQSSKTETKKKATARFSLLNGAEKKLANVGRRRVTSHWMMPGLASLFVVDALSIDMGIHFLINEDNELRLDRRTKEDDVYENSHVSSIVT